MCGGCAPDAHKSRVLQKAFATRVDVWQAWQRSDEEGRKARIRHEKLGREGRVSNERLHSSLLDVTDAEGKALALKRDFDLVGLKCKEEMARFDHEKVTDLRAAVDTWLQGQIERQQEVRSPPIASRLSKCSRLATAYRRVGAVLRLARASDCPAAA